MRTWPCSFCALLPLVLFLAHRPHSLISILSCKHTTVSHQLAIFSHLQPPSATSCRRMRQLTRSALCGSHAWHAHVCHGGKLLTKTLSSARPRPSQLI